MKEKKEFCCEVKTKMEERDKEQLGQDDKALGMKRAKQLLI